VGCRGLAGEITGLGCCGCGCGAAVRQALDLGPGAIGQRALTLGARLRGQLAGLPGVTTHDLGQARCAIVTAKIGRLEAEPAAAALRRAGVNVSTTVPGDNPLPCAASRETVKREVCLDLLTIAVEAGLLAPGKHDPGG